MKHLKKFNENFYKTNEFYGGPIKDQMNRIVQKLIDYLEEYRKIINDDNALIDSEDKSTEKISNMYDYLIKNKSLSTMSSSNESKRNRRINEFYGGPIKDTMNPIVQKLIDYLEEYRKFINDDNAIVDSEDKSTEKISNMYKYLIVGINIF